MVRRNRPTAATRTSVSDDLYAQLEAEAVALYDDQSEFLANAGNFAALVRHELPDVNWAGFYLVTPRGDLELGPFSGRPACTRIAKGKGVCGTAAQQRETLVVPDVSAFAGHIACDIASRSEIVIPLIRNAKVWAVFDIDSPLLNRFAQSDKAAIERLVEAFAHNSPSP